MATDPCLASNEYILLTLAGGPRALTATPIPAQEPGNGLALHATKGIYLREFLSDSVGFAGISRYNSWHVTQKAGGANRSVDVNFGISKDDVVAISDTAGGTLDYGRSYGLAPGSSPDLGTLAPAALNLAIAAADPTNPRIDLIIIPPPVAPFGRQAPAPVIVQGTPTAAATKDNLLGIGSPPAGSIILAATELPAAATTVPNAKIRDLRQQSRRGVVPFASSVDGVVFESPLLSPTSRATLAPSLAAYSLCAAMWLPQRIIADHIQWAYIINSSAGAIASQHYAFTICDAGGRPIPNAATGSTAWQNTGGGSGQDRQYIDSVGLGAAVDFPAGLYYLNFRQDSIPSSAAVFFNGWDIREPPTTGIALSAATALAPSTNIFTEFQDVIANNTLQATQMLAVGAVGFPRVVLSHS